MTGQRDGQGAGAPSTETPRAGTEAEATPPDLPQAPVQATLRSAQPSSADALATLVSEREPETPASRRRPAAIARQLGGGRFELSEHLGAGSMGVVYAAFDRQKKERVALKTLQNLEATSIQRLKQEFRSLASVAHPNLVRLRELFADADEVFFTMDLVDGLPLSKFLEADPVRRGDFQLLRNAFRQLAEGLGALHSYGKIHRDLKPSNVMVRNDGRVVVLDFGVTCDVDAARSTSERGMIAGTPAYMAPEQVNGEVTSIASDWYAFGTMLYEALTGRLPFDGALLELLNAKTSGAPLPIESPERSGGLEGALRRALVAQRRLATARRRSPRAPRGRARVRAKRFAAAPGKQRKEGGIRRSRAAASRARDGPAPNAPGRARHRARFGSVGHRQDDAGEGISGRRLRGKRRARAPEQVLRAGVRPLQRVRRRHRRPAESPSPPHARGAGEAHAASRWRARCGLPDARRRARARRTARAPSGASRRASPDGVPRTSRALRAPGRDDAGRHVPRRSAVGRQRQRAAARRAARRARSAARPDRRLVPQRRAHREPAHPHARARGQGRVESGRARESRRSPTRRPLISSRGCSARARAPESTRSSPRRAAIPFSCSKWRSRLRKTPPIFAERRSPT